MVHRLTKISTIKMIVDNSIFSGVMFLLEILPFLDKNKKCIKQEK